MPPDSPPLDSPRPPPTAPARPGSVVVAVIATETAGDVRVVTLDRPARRNALTLAGLDDLETAVDSTDAPVVLLTGAGAAFCAGADLDAVADLDDRPAAEQFAARGQAVARTVADSEAVVVAGIDGPARGGGVELALAADVRVATPAATIAEPGVDIGLFGAWGGTVRLPELVGPSDAADLALSGRVVDAEEARRMGLVSRVVEEPRSVAEEIANADHDALSAVKALLRDDADRETRERRERAAFGRLWESFERDRA